MKRRTNNININVIGKHPVIGSVWLVDMTVERFYQECENIYSVRFPCIIKPFSFKDIENLTTLFEELIHQCLPDPNSSFDLILDGSEDYMWKWYFYTLLVDDKEMKK